MASETTTIEVRRQVHKQVKILAVNIGVNIKTLYDEMLTKGTAGTYFGSTIKVEKMSSMSLS